MEHQLYSPVIHLFAYHLFKPSNAKSKVKIIHPDHLWNICHKILKEFGIARQLKLRFNVPENSRADLLDGETINDFLLKIKTKIYNENEEIQLEGFAYPLQIFDSYALALNIGYPDPTEGKLAESVDISLLKQLNPNYCLLPSQIGSNLGQTLLITAWLDEVQKQQSDNSLKELADKCIEKFIPKHQDYPLFYCQGKLFGSPIFEYGLINQRENYCHILVWLFDDARTNEIFWNCYQELIDIFFYRNKIIRNYWESRDAYQKAYREYEKIENLIDNILKIVPQQEPLDEQTLNKLKNQLKQIPQQSLEYAGFLRDLGFYSNSITIHTDNYQEKLRIISNKLTSEFKNDLSFLKRFSEENCSVYQGQIQADLGYFVHGSSLLDKVIASIRGIVEIDQAERDRELQKQLRESEAKRDREREDNEAREKQRDRELQKQREDDEAREKQRDLQFQLWIGAVGFGLAVSGVTSQVEPRPIEAICSQLPSVSAICSQLPLQEIQPDVSTHNIGSTIINVFVHVSIGLLFGLVAYIFLRSIFGNQLRKKDSSAN